MLSYLYLNRKDRRNYNVQYTKMPKKTSNKWSNIHKNIRKSDLDIYNQTTYKITLNNMIKEMIENDLKEAKKDILLNSRSFKYE